jgi:hypothetical protein
MQPAMDRGTATPVCVNAIDANSTIATASRGKKIGPKDSTRDPDKVLFPFSVGGNVMRVHPFANVPKDSHKLAGVSL